MNLICGNLCIARDLWPRHEPEPHICVLTLITPAHYGMPQCHLPSRDACSFWAKFLINSWLSSKHEFLDSVKTPDAGSRSRYGREQHQNRAWDLWESLHQIDKNLRTDRKVWNLGGKTHRNSRDRVPVLPSGAQRFFTCISSRRIASLRPIISKATPAMQKSTS